MWLFLIRAHHHNLDCIFNGQLLNDVRYNSAQYTHVTNGKPDRQYLEKQWPSLPNTPQNVILTGIRQIVNNYKSFFDLCFPKDKQNEIFTF